MNRLKVYLLITLCTGYLTLSMVLAQDYPVKFLGIEDGLSNNAVMSIHQDENGFMWLGTYDGLNRYDGYEFTIFRNQIGDTSSIPSNTVFAIEGDSDHRLWVGGQKGASIYDPVKDQFKQLFYKPVERDILLPLTYNVHQIKMIRGGDLLIACQDIGLILFDRDATSGRQIVLEEGAIQKYEVTAIEQGSDSAIVWIFIQNKGLYTYNTENKTLRLESTQITHASSLQFTPDKNVWLGNQNGLFLYNTSQKKYSDNRLPIASPVVDISLDKKETLWVGTDGGGVFLLQKGDTISRHTGDVFSNPIVKSNSVWRILEDKNGRKWIGTLRGGVSMVEPREKLFKHITYGTKASVPVEDFILSFGEDRAQNIWIGTDGAGLRYWNRTTNAYTQYKHKRSDPTSLSSNFITNILQDSYGELWVSTWFGGINRFRASTGSFERFNCFNTDLGVIERNIWILYEDKQKELWASATNTGSLYKYNRSKSTFELFDTEIKDLQALTETSNGEFWGGNYTTLIKIDRKNKQHEYFPIGYTIRCLYEDKKQHLWIGTQEGGLLLFDRKTNTYNRFTVDDGLPGNTVLRILEDKSGALWMSTYDGITKLDTDKKTFRNFTISDGLQSNQFSFNGGLALKSGEFLFGGINGFNVFHPEEITAETVMPKVLLNGLMVGNVPIKGGDAFVRQLKDNIISDIELPYDKAVVSIDFLALNYSGADKLNYAFKLEGWDKDWNYIQKGRRANYSKLSEGSYTFKVKVTGADGKWSDETQLLHMVVLPPWYRTWWAYLSGFLLITSSIFIYNRYTRKQERLKYEVKLVTLEREKDKELAEKQVSIFTNVSHEFRTHLSLIISPLKKMLSAGDATVSKDLDTAYRNSRRLLSLVDQLLLFKKAENQTDFLKVSATNITALCKEVFACFEHLASSKKLDFVLQLPDEDIIVYGDHEKIEIALFNIISNAFKFTAHGSITVQLYESEQAVQLKITDTGIGIPEKDIERIFGKFEQGTSDKKSSGFGVGLYLVQHFISLHKGNISCSSVPDEGTTMLLELKKGKTHFPENTIWQESTSSSLLEELAVFETVTTETHQIVLQESPELISSRAKILVIDDNPDMRAYVSRLFEKEYLVYEAENGISGLKTAEQHLPDIIISDVNMDGMDGLELCLRVKQSEELSHIPVILLTAVDAAEVKLKGVASGADDYITKPFDDALLLTRVDVTLKSRNQLRKYFLDNITLQQNTLKVPREYREFLQQCIQVVEFNLDNEDFNIKYFARQMGMSHSALYNKVKAISGQSLNAFIRSIRIRRAAVLMLTGEMNISQAAFQVGLGDVKYFRQQFVKLFGITPSEYIKKYKHNFNAELNVVKINE